MSTVSIEEARAKLPELIRDLRAGEEVVITQGQEPVACLLPAATAAARGKRHLGSLRGTVTYIASDFDAPLEDFKEYMA